MKIGLFTDVHANLPALEVSIKRFRELECDMIIHLGDLIGIGPYPRECLELAISIGEMQFIMGNHDHWYGYGFPEPIPGYMNQEEVAHHRWTHAQIGEPYKAFVKTWKFTMDVTIGNFNLNFRHYGLNKEKNWFRQHIKYPSADQLDRMFDDVEADMVFYGHNHISSDLQGRTRYVNLGSSGCFDKAIARIGILNINGDTIELQKEALEYNDHNFLNEYDLRDVPARDFIRKVFLNR